MRVDAHPFRVMLISLYELGRQPFGVASPAAWLRAAGATVTSADLAVQPLDEETVREADFIAVYVPMHTATRIATEVIRRVRAINASVSLCAYGLYAPMNAEFLRKEGVEYVIGGEFEAPLRDLVCRLRAQTGRGGPGSVTSLARQQFLVPDRSGLPPLSLYAKLRLPDGTERLVGYTEASRGCKHLCRHCPIVPVYHGQFRIVQQEVVLADIRQQVEAGAEHITFGDPDFFNGPRHALGLVEAMHRRFPALTYDVTIKVEHLLRRQDSLPSLRDTGCAFVTTAVESVDDRVLALLDKGHTRADFVRLVAAFREADLVLQPTFVAFTPWTTLDGYRDLLATIRDFELVEHVAPIQLVIRLLIPAGSRLLELPDVQRRIDTFDQDRLTYAWRHADPRVDALQRELEMLVMRRRADADRLDVFREIWERTHEALGIRASLPAVPPGRPRVTIPYLTEPWYC